MSCSSARATSLAWLAIADGPVGRRVGVPVARQVEREQRALQGERDRVEGVGVLGAAVEEDELGRRVAPVPARSAGEARRPSTKKRRTGGTGTSRPHSRRFSSKSENSSYGITLTHGIVEDGC